VTSAPLQCSNVRPYERIIKKKYDVVEHEFDDSKILPLMTAKTYRWNFRYFYVSSTYLCQL